MQQSVEYGKRYWYDHMAVGDRPIWERFMERYPDMFTSVMYDVPVGNVPEHANESIVAEGADMSALYKRRIDVVGETADHFWVVEVKPRAGSSTIGQVLGYEHLFIRDWKPEKPVNVLVVCEQTDSDTLEFADTQGVLVMVV